MESFEHTQPHEVGPQYEKISPTAKLVAHLRTFTGLPYARALAERSDSLAAYNQIAGQHGELLKRFTPLIEARYLATNTILKERDTKNIFELACGLSPRALAMTSHPNVRYIATDLPDMLSLEEKLMQAIMDEENVPHPGLHFESANALDLVSLQNAAVHIPEGAPMDVVNEGLLMYLSREEKRKVAENVRTLLQERPGVWITPDVGTRDFMERILKADPSLRAILEQLTGITERNIETNTFADHTDMANFFAEVGFDLELCPHTSTLHDLSSPDALGITVDAAQKMLAGRNTAVLTPRP